MQPGIHLAVYLAKDSQARARQDADAWRRLHGRPDCPPSPAKPGAPNLVERLAFALPRVRRLRLR